VSGPRIGALCAGYGGLDMAVHQVLGGELAWVAEKDPAASKVLDHRFPGVPNLGDITITDWAQVEPVDVITAGFPCQDLSLAGRRTGLRAGTRSGIWSYVRDAVAALRPPLVVIENVRGLLSAGADGDVEPCPWCLGDGSGEPAVRALGVVLADLAELGFDAEWVGLRAADVGACHGRFRVGVLAWPAADAERGRRDGWASQPIGSAVERAVAARDRVGVPPHADSYALRLEPVALARSDGPALARLAGSGRPSDVAEDADCAAGGERWQSASGEAPSGWARADTGGPDRARTSADADSLGLGPDERYLRQGQPDAAGCARTTDGGGLNGHPDEAGSGEVLRGLRCADGAEAVRPRGQDTGGPGSLQATPDMLPVVRQHKAGSDQGRAPLAGSAASGLGLLDVRVDGEAARPPQGPEPGERRPEQPRDAVRLVPSQAALAGGPGEAACGCSPGSTDSCSTWGPYAAAIHRWEVRLGRLAPPATELGSRGQPRLSPKFVEFMQGLPAGWVTAVPGLSRNDQLRILGNGVVPQQFVEAIRHLMRRAFGDEAAA
jgi:DNA (cytosine-5)-methyltransferase 1